MLSSVLSPSCLEIRSNHPKTYLLRALVSARNTSELKLVAAGTGLFLWKLDKSLESYPRYLLLVQHLDSPPASWPFFCISTTVWDRDHVFLLGGSSQLGIFMANNVWNGSSTANHSLPNTWLRALSNHLCLHHSFFRYRERTWWWSSRAAAGWSTSFQQTFHIIQLCPWKEKQVSRLTQKPLFHWSVILPWLNHSVEFTCECLWSCTFSGGAFWGCHLLNNKASGPHFWD